MASVFAMAVLLGGCTSAPESNTTQPGRSPSMDASTPSPGLSPSSSPEPVAVIPLGDFPAFPDQPFSMPVSTSLQAVLDGAVQGGTVNGVTAAVIVGDQGHWSGAAGLDPQQDRLTADSHVVIASIGKTVTAAQVLRLVEDGAIGLDDPVADLLPAELNGFQANGATIRDLLGMRSGIHDPPTYIESVDEGATLAELVEMLPEPQSRPGSSFSYANVNYVLLGSIIEHATGRSLWEVLRSDVLHRPGLEGVRYPVHDALAADGWQIESDPASLSRWGYELYGGSVLSAGSLRAMTEFDGGFYGLGVVNLTGENAATLEGFGEPAVGHAGLEPGVATMLVAFPETGEVVSVQTYGGSLVGIKPVIEDLLAAVRQR